MIIIGELINASRKAIKAAIEGRDAAAIQKVAKDQAEAGADFIDVNAGIFVGQEPEYLTWLVQTVQQVTDKPCAIDSPDPAAIEAALAVHQGTPMINSISLEKERYEKLMPIIAGTDLKVIALSALLTTTMPAMETTIKAVKEAGLSARTIIGGAPVTQTFADQIGADGYSADAPGAVRLVKTMVA